MSKYEITLKNIRYSDFASQETQCFEATVYINGKRSFIASNDGQGGANCYHPIKGGNLDIYKQVNKINNELSKEKIQTQYGEMENCLEMVIGDLVDSWLLQKEAKRLLKNVCIINDGELLSFRITNAEFKKNVSDITMAIKKKFKEAEILNGLQFCEAFKKMESVL